MKAVAVWISTLLFLTSCASTHIRFNDKWNPKSKPAYEDYLDYYWFGLKGRHQISLQKICVDQQPYGMRELMTGEDLFLAFITFGIYVPVTVRVWCGD